MLKHTPGPWWYAEYGPHSYIATVCHVGSFSIGPKFDRPHEVSYDDHGSDEADARLIATAPELLACLIEYIAAADNSMTATDDVAAMLRFGEADAAARAVIFKATGQQA